ncbi:hypothetical protein [Devosia sp. 1566]|uniref:hypothetical protein n=1 Tax=Devosia sp. 1566 TaxID=2499144 RepID=UPI000FD8F94B|nr:hypothetical protein [Devosia sp. 1566]
MDTKKFTSSKLVLLQAFRLDEAGKMVPAFAPRKMRDESAAYNAAEQLVRSYLAVIAWTQPTHAAGGEVAERTIVFRHGDLPEVN